MSDKPMPSSFDDLELDDRKKPLVRLWQRVKAEPLIPLGLTLTVGAFIGACRAVRRGDSHGAQRMFRARVAAQGFTILACMGGGLYYSQDRAKRRELDRLKRERDNEEKRRRWIRELEHRDREEKTLQLARDEGRKARAAAAAATAVDSEAEPKAPAARTAEPLKRPSAPSDTKGDGRGGVVSAMGGLIGLPSKQVPSDEDAVEHQQQQPANATSPEPNGSNFFSGIFKSSRKPPADNKPSPSPSEVDDGEG